MPAQAEVVLPVSPVNRVSMAKLEVEAACIREADRIAVGAELPLSLVDVREVYSGERRRRGGFAKCTVLRAPVLMPAERGPHDPNAASDPNRPGRHRGVL